MTAVTKHIVSAELWNAIAPVSEIARIMRERPVNRATIIEVLELISRTVSYDRATLFMFDKTKDSLKEIASRGGTVNIIDFIHLGKGFGLAGWVAQQRKPVYLPGRNPDTRDGVKHHHDTVAIFPLLVADELIGVMCFAHHNADAYDENCRNLLEMISGQVAISLERIMNQKELGMSNQRIEEMERELKNIERAAKTGTSATVAQLAQEINREIANFVAAIIGQARMIELEAENLPEDTKRRLAAILDGAQKISLATHKLLKLGDNAGVETPQSNNTTLEEMQQKSEPGR